MTQGQYFQIGLLLYAVGVIIASLVYWRMNDSNTDYDRRPWRFLFDSVVVGVFWPVYVLIGLIALAGAAI